MSLKLNSKWAGRKLLKISSAKSQITLFTPDTKEFRDKPQVYYDGSMIPVENTIKILGITLDTKQTFTPHVSIARSKGSGRVSILKAVTGRIWGFQKEDLLLMFTAFITPVLGFGVPIWYPARSSLKAPVASLQTVQNAALRVVTGCHKATAIQHLHDECQVLPVQEHLEMQCTQFLANALQSHHPSHEIVSNPPAARPPMKPTLQHCFGHKVAKYLQAGVITQLTYKRAVKEIHTEAVASYRAKREPNRVLGYPAPDVHPSEASLPRAHRVTLRQLRGWWCKDLRSFQKYINKTQDEDCPECGASAHMTPHLFACPATPTTLRPIDLWE
jgi:hypothetical protein